MTRDRGLFAKGTKAGKWLPVVEGRMVQQHRSRAKAYIAGTGRAAHWETLSMRDSGAPRSQFFVSPQSLPRSRQQRSETARVGFCDIVGQTNERTLQAAVIAPGQICGNKVPTIDLLDDADDPDRVFVLVAVLNSLPVDWLLRRVVTTSVNFFVLLGLALPRVEQGSRLAARLAALARLLHASEGDTDADMRNIASWRAEIDQLVLAAYGLAPADMRLMIADFPLIDRGQPPLSGEARSTITRDLLQSVCDPADNVSAARHTAATALGALAYVPEEFSRAYKERPV